MFESIFGVIVSSFLGLIFVELRDMRTQMNKIENDIIVMKLLTPKRKTDVDNLNKLHDD